MRIRIKPGTHPACYVFTRHKKIEKGLTISTYVDRNLAESNTFGTYRRRKTWMVEEVRMILGEPLYFLSRL